MRQSDILSDILICSKCTLEWDRPFRLAAAQFQQNPFVCENCRCKDCSIVLGFECECGNKHAEPDLVTPEICAECAEIRKRVALLDPELADLRNSDIADEQKKDPVKGLKRHAGICITDTRASNGINNSEQTITGEN